MKKHIIKGLTCWCNPYTQDGVIIHNKEDNWKQYAKEGETAQDVIERTRADLDSFVKLYINKENNK